MIDTHCHIDLYPQPEGLLEEIKAQGMTVIAVTNLPSHYELGEPHVRGYRRVRLAVGLHPLLADQHTLAEKRRFFAASKRCSYIGEVGLDGSSHARHTLLKQREGFNFVLEAINDRPRFITVHSRGAEQEVLESLEQFAVSPAVFHWYSGPLYLVEAIIAAGHYFSLNPAMVGTKRWEALLEQLPPERILTESDGPHIRVKRSLARPSDVQIVENGLSVFWDLSKMDVRKTLSKNFRRIILPLTN